jgi:hypothetical protein
LLFIEESHTAHKYAVLEQYRHFKFMPTGTHITVVLKGLT